MSLTITNTDNVTDGGALELDGLWALTTVEVGGTTYILAGGLDDDGISVFRLEADGTLTNVFNLADSVSLQLDRVRIMLTAEIGGVTYVYVTGEGDDGLSVLRLNADGSLDSIQDINDNATLQLNGAYGIGIVTVGADTYLYASGNADNGVSGFRIESDGTLTNVVNVPASESDLGGAAGSTIVTVGSSHFLVICGETDSVLTVFGIGADGSLSRTDTVFDTAATLLAIPYDVASVTVGGSTYLYATSSGESGIAVFSLAADGTLTHVQNVADAAGLRILGAMSVDSFMIGDAHYVVCGGTEAGFSIFRVGADGTLTPDSTVVDNATLELLNFSSLATVEAHGKTWLAAGGYGDDGFSLFELAGSAAPVQGANAGLTLNEAANGTITAALLDFNDAEPDTAITYTLTTLASHGTVLLNDVALGLGGTFTQDDINASRVTYAHDGSETTSDSFGFSVSDGDGGFVAGQSFAFTVTPVNDAPVATVPAFVTTDMNVPVAITGLMAADPDLDPAVDAITGKLIADQGTLFIRTDVPGGLEAGQLTANNAGAIFFLNATLDQLNATFSASGGLMYTPPSGVTGNIQLRLGLADYGQFGLDPGIDDSPDTESDEEFFTVTVNATNSAPVLNVNAGDTVGEGSVTTITTSELDFNDGEQADAAIVYTITGETNGYVRLNHLAIGVGNSFTQADINAGLITFGHDSSETTAAAFTFSVSDGAGGTVTGQTFNLAVTPANDTPTITDIPAFTIVEQAPMTLNPSFTVSDVELDARNGGLGDYAGATFVINRNGNSAQDQFGFDTSGALFTVDGNALKAGGLTFATLALGTGVLNIVFNSAETVATTALVNDVLRHLQYTNISDNPTASFNLGYSLLDGGLDGSQGTGGNKSDSGLTAVTVTGVNDAPLIGQLDGDSGTYIEGGSPLIIDGGTLLTLSDADSSNFDGGELRISITGNAAAGDVLGIQIGGSPAIALSNGTQAGSTITVGSFTIGTIRAGGDGAGGNDLIIDLAGAASISSRVTTLLRAITFSSTSDTPGTAQRTVTITLNDGDGTAGGGDDSSSVTVTVGVTEVADSSAAVGDAAAVAEDATVAIDVLANDLGPDGGPLELGTVAEINGAAAQVGVAIALASGATATLNSDGTISYDPKGRFDTLISADKAASTGASNASAADSFTYTLSTGLTATVSVTVQGVDSAEDVLAGGAGNDVVAGLPGSDFFMANQGGNDSVAGGQGDDFFYFGTAYSGADTVEGGLGNDTLILQGSYALTFTEGSVLALETLVLMSGADTRYGASGTGNYTYDLVAVDGMVAAGARLTIQGNRLLATESLRFDGSAETDGSFRLVGGAGVDVLKGGGNSDMLVGGLGADLFTGNDGGDVFVYRDVAESTLAASDEILDFDAGDRIDLRGIDANSLLAGNDAFAFIGSDAFHQVAGELRLEFDNGVWNVLGDVDGDGVADFAITLHVANGHTPGVGDFYL